jgi:hypothetical protein
VQDLLAAGAEVKDTYGKSAINLASHCNHYEIKQMLKYAIKINK